jgi:hypothetical protein
MAVAAFSLTACGGPTTQVRVAQPTFLGGHYFMFGDAACPRAAPFPGQAVAMCHTDAGQPTGERRAALTNQQLEMWKYNQQVAMQRQAQVSAQKSALADRMMNMDFGTNYGYQPMPTPQVAPLTLGRSNNVAHCITVSSGFYTNCRY